MAGNDRSKKDISRRSILGGMLKVGIAGTVASLAFKGCRLYVPSQRQYGNAPAREQEPAPRPKIRNTAKELFDAVADEKSEKFITMVPEAVLTAITQDREIHTFPRPECIYFKYDSAGTCKGNLTYDPEAILDKTESLRAIRYNFSFNIPKLGVPQFNLSLSTLAPEIILKGGCYQEYYTGDAMDRLGRAREVIDNWTKRKRWMSFSDGSILDENDKESKMDYRLFNMYQRVLDQVLMDVRRHMLEKPGENPQLERLLL